MGTTHPAVGGGITHDMNVRRIDIADLRWALREGWDDFMELRGDLIFIGAIYPFVGLLAALVALDQSLVPLLFPAAAGISLLGPAVASGFYEMARRRETHDDIRWRHFFDAFTGPSGPHVGWLTAAVGVIFLLWLFAAGWVSVAAYGGNPPGTFEAFFGSLFTTREGWTMIIVGNIVGLAFAVVAMTLSVVSFPMVVDKPHVGGAKAVETSIRAVMRNFGVMLVWGLIVAVLLVAGAIPFFVGLAFVLPWLGYSTWHLYTRLVER